MERASMLTLGPSQELRWPLRGGPDPLLSSPFQGRAIAYEPGRLTGAHSGGRDDATGSLPLKGGGRVGVGSTSRAEVAVRRPAGLSFSITGVDAEPTPSHPP